MNDYLTRNAFDTLSTFEVEGRTYTYFSLKRLENDGIGAISRLPYSTRVLLESLLRNLDGLRITEQDVRNLATYKKRDQVEVPFVPARVVMQDFTGVPAVVDLAAMRDAMKQLGGDPQRINPLVPVDLVVDHSIQVDHFRNKDSLMLNTEMEFERNGERYAFLRWGQKVLENFNVVPPASGIVHQVNLEYLAKVVQRQTVNGQTVVYPDTLVGTDSHTTMINGLGVIGWGVGGIEAEAVMLGEPINMLAPKVVGFRLSGKLPEGATATDLVLVVTQMLRKKGVVEKFVEFYGPGLAALSLPDRATIANMAPEYGATVGFFPVDDETLVYLRETGRDAHLIELVKRYHQEQGLFRDENSPEPDYDDVLELDLSTVQPSLSGPKRPQDRVLLKDMKNSWRATLSAPIKERGFDLPADQLEKRTDLTVDGKATSIGHGSVVIAAITSCTNTSNPSVMIGAGLLAKKAVEKGLSVKPYVKTSLAPGSKVVTDYLNKAELAPYLETLGFNTVGYGCTTCIGNSGPLDAPVAEAVERNGLVVAGVLSGNRNFEGRINPHIKANWLASPPLVVAYALAGTVDIDFQLEPVGLTSKGEKVYLKDIWPTNEEIRTIRKQSLTAKAFTDAYDNIAYSNDVWNSLPVENSPLYQWNDDSTYIQNPPFFEGLTLDVPPIAPITEACVLIKVGDSVTTDHISPAGNIAADSPAGRYLQEMGVERRDFNTYGSRRGNDRVMTRGTFANIRLKNQLAPGTEGSFTTYFGDSTVMSIFDAAERYKDDGTPTIVLAGKDYGMGSSRDWAAKGTYLLGVKAVIAESYERIHRSNLIGMGVLPLIYADGENAESLGLTGRERFSLDITDEIKPGQTIMATVTDENGKARSIALKARLDSKAEIDTYRHGGILRLVLRKMNAG
jgi:aconitate hydratase